LAILEAAITGDPAIADAALVRRVEAIDETVAAMDLNGDGAMTDQVAQIRGLPGRYVDPEQPTLLSTRMKEVRYSKKVLWLDAWASLRAYELEHEDKDADKVPMFSGSPLVGLRNDFGWQLQGSIGVNSP
jgi:hypothetical protein